MKRHVKSIRNTRAIGDDGIPIVVWKSCIGVLVRPLVSIINKSLQEGRVPDQFKISKVCPLLKKNKDSKMADSYRPVSILTAVSKVLESIVYEQLSKYLEEADILPPQQHGFRKNHSVSTAVAMALSKWAKLPIGAAIGSFDLSEAFNTVQTSTLLKMLECVNADPTALCWMKSYLSGGKQCAVWNSIKVEACCRHGSLLARTLDNSVAYADNNSGASTDTHH